MSSIKLLPYTQVFILNQDTGHVRTEVGPKIVILKGGEKQKGSQFKSTLVTKDQYLIVDSPYDKKQKKCLVGDKRIIEGPCVYSRKYEEKVGYPQNVFILKQGHALNLQATSDFGDKHAGQKWQIQGPQRFVPNKYTKVVERVSPILINHNEGIYIKNVLNSDVKLVTGPVAYLRGVNEQFYYKNYSSKEKIALGLGASTYRATFVQLKLGEVICVLDEKKREKTITGPCNYILGPQEHVKVLWLSAGKPKKPYQIRAAIIKKGPDFVSDKFQIRTKDNAHLELLLTYKWEFLVEKSDAYKIFSVLDFIGYACSTLCSQIREGAASFSFEEFHDGTVGTLRKLLFKKQPFVFESGKKIEVHGYLFEEIGLLISAVDVKGVEPVNKEINDLLNQSIKGNMRIVCNKMQQKATLDAKKVAIEAKKEIGKLKKKLIDIKNENYSLETIEKAKISGQALIEKAKAQKESTEIREKSVIENQKLKIQSILNLLKTKEGERYLELQKIKNFAKIKQNWVVQSSTNVSLFK